MAAPVPLSVLDLSPVLAGSSAADAIHQTLDLARHADALGLRRYWLAEHHNAGGLASSAPEILIGAVAAATARLRVGSGGIMLPNHSPLKVAEVFRVLSALHPGRVDLGLGRAAGTDKRTALALRQAPELLGDARYEEDVDRLLALLSRDPDPTVPFNDVKAAPIGVPAPPVWILGSGRQSAALAAARGLGFAFAHHFAPEEARDALAIYRDAFRPSPELARPATILAASVICGDDAAHAARLAASAEIAWLRFGQGLRDLPLPSVEEALGVTLDPDEESVRALHRARSIVGGRAEVEDALAELLEATGADELMVTTHVHDPAERRRSYERLAASRVVARA